MSVANVVERDVNSLTAHPCNARVHSKKQIKQIAESIRRFGWTTPLLITMAGEIIAGHGRLMAAKLLGIKTVPVIVISHLSPAEIRALVIADNKIAQNAGWDREILAIEFQALIDLEFDLSLTGFSLAEIDLVLDEASDSDPGGPTSPEDKLPAPAVDVVSRRGDIWQLGRHRLICGDAQQPADYSVLLGNERVDLMFADVPYNVPIDGHVSGLGKTKHREFAFASGEMSKSEFTGFLMQTLSLAALAMRDGAIAYACIDWRHMGEMLRAGEFAFTELKNLVVWNKTNAGMGTFYRSKHELIFVFKNGAAPHTNSFGLGDTGRYRTNVWDYPGMSSMGANRRAELAMHPTVKPVAMVADAIRDCSKRGEIVLDMFGGSGTTLIAAEKTGRRARLIEIDPAYCDTIVRRWETLTGKRALLTSTGQTFEEAAESRGALSLEHAA